MNKQFSIRAVTAALALSASFADAAVFIKYDGIDGESDNNGKWFVADSFSFGVEREMKESGEKGGTADINIGVGELQEMSIAKIQDASTIELAQLSLTGRSLGKVEVCVTTDDSSAGPAACYMHIVLERAFVKSWSTSGDADDRPTEEVAFYYNKIAFGYANSDAVVSWNNEKNRAWEEGKSFLFNSR